MVTRMLVFVLNSKSMLGLGEALSRGLRGATDINSN
jgi:hypothetical protein